MKAQDYLITRQQYQDSPVNKGGVFLPPLGILRNFNVADPQAPTDAELDKIFTVYWQSAFDDINAFNSDRPLNVVQYIDLQNAKAANVIRDATILQVNELLKNGLTELKNSDQASTGAFTSTVSPNIRIVSPDQLSQDVEDKLQEVDYREWRVEVDKDEITVTLRGERLLIAKTANMIALSSLIFEGLDNQDITFLGKNKIIAIINSEIASARSFRGRWNAASVQIATDIQQVFTTTGLPLTDGNITLTQANTIKGDTILVTVTSDPNYSPEEVVFDGVNWVQITNNNQEKLDITQIKARLSQVETNLATNTQAIADNKAKIANDRNELDAKDAQQDQLIQQNKVLATNEQAERQLNTNARLTWEQEKSTYVRVDDIIINTPVSIVGRKFTKPSANIYEMSFGLIPAGTYGNNLPAQDIPALDLSNFVNGGTVVIKGLDGQVRLDPRDSYNDASSTAQVLILNNDQDKKVQVKIDSTKATITGNLGGDEQNLLNATWEILEQISGATGSVDQTARNNAQTADQKATQAIADALKKVDKQLLQGGAGTGADFETFSQFKALLTLGDLVAISFATGINLTGRVADDGGGNAANPVGINGYLYENDELYIGNFAIDDQFNITGGDSITEFIKRPQQNGTYLIKRAANAITYVPVTTKTIIYTFDDNTTENITHIKE